MIVALSDVYDIGQAVVELLLQNQFRGPSGHAITKILIRTRTLGCRDIGHQQSEALRMYAGVPV